ncbi:Mannosyl-oligosaccharide alpha-1,2-mannosidase, partial [Globisporangium splendens]
MLLPSFSSATPPKLAAAGRRPLLSLRRALVLVLGAVLCLFLWLQYTLFTTNFGALDAAVARTPKSATAIMHDNNGKPVLVTATPSPAPDTKRHGLRHEREKPSFGFDTLNRMPPSDLQQPQRHYDKPLRSSAPRTPTPPIAPASPEEQAKRPLAVKSAMQFAWKNYEEIAFGADEVDPKYGLRREDVWGAIACSLVDGMDTLWIMGMKDEFARAREYVATSLRFDHLGKDRKKISVFETIIREVGGLLSAFSLSQDGVFKDKARELMDLLTPAFSEEEGVFYTLFNPYTKERTFASWAGYKAHIADIGTLQLETRYLSDITGDPKYAKMGDAFYEILQREGSYLNTGLFPVHFDAHNGKFHTKSSVTFGALGDSFYEYLIKVYIYSGKRDNDAYLRKLYDDAVDGLEKHLLVYSKEDDLYYLQELKLPSMSGVHRMDHLLCFVPGMLALGTLAETEDTAKNARHLDIAKKLMETCYQMYRRQPTGLSPDIVSFPHMLVRDGKYRLRPETIESLFYLYRITKDVKYREYGWKIFQAIETHAKLKYGYGAIKDVAELPARNDNKMESFFLAETLKYLYLLQAPDDLIPLDEYVFNTEAHPIRIRKRKA